MSQPIDPITNPAAASNPTLDSMPEIPTFEPAPVPKPVVTDTMPPIPVTAPTTAPAPVKSADMPVMTQRPQPAVPRPTTSGMPQSLNTPNPAVSATPASPAVAPVAAARPVAPAAPAQPTVPANPTAPINAPVNTPVRPVTAAPTQPNQFSTTPSVPSVPPVQPVVQSNPNPNQFNQAQPTPNTQPIQPTPAQSPVADSMQRLLDEQSSNPFAEAAAKNNEIRNVSFSAPNATIAPSNSVIKDKKKLLLVGGVIVLVVVLAIMLIAMSLGGNGNQPNQGGSSSNTPVTPTTKAGNYICSRDYLDSEIHSYGDTVQSVSRTVELEFSDKGFKNIESKTTITYDDATVVKDGYAAQKEQHAAAYEALGFTNDPLVSSYKRDGTKLIVTRSADVSSLNTKSLSLFGITAQQTPSTLTSDDVLDLFESDKFSCKEKTDAEEVVEDTTDETTTE